MPDIRRVNFQRQSRSGDSPIRLARLTEGEDYQIVLSFDQLFTVGELDADTEGRQMFEFKVYDWDKIKGFPLESFDLIFFKDIRFEIQSRAWKLRGRPHVLLVAIPIGTNKPTVT